MNIHTSRPVKDAVLRLRAEEPLNVIAPGAGSPGEDDDTPRLLHELEIHQFDVSASICG